MSHLKVQTALGGALVRITLNRPEKYNAFDALLLRELGEAARAVGDTKARLVVLDGEGTAFCSGGDLVSASQSGNTSGYLGTLARQFHAVLETFAALDAVFMTVVHGPAVGGGMALALAGDLRYATAEAKFRVGYARAGLTVDGGLSWRLPRLVGLAQAQRILIEDPDIDADEAHALGLVHDILPKADIPRRCEAVLQSLQKQGRMAVSRNRTLLLEGMQRPLADCLEAEASMMKLSAGTPDGMEGLKAFIEKRPPKF